MTKHSTKHPASLVGALYYNCLVTLVMATIYTGTAISEAKDDDESKQEVVFSILYVVPSVIISMIGMGMMKKGVAPGDNEPLLFGMISMVVAIAEGFVAAVYLGGLIQNMYAAVAALQFASTIISVMLWFSLIKPEESFKFERV